MIYANQLILFESLIKTKARNMEIGYKLEKGMSPTKDHFIRTTNGCYFSLLKIPTLKNNENTIFQTNEETIRLKY